MPLHKAAKARPVKAKAHAESHIGPGAKWLSVGGSVLGVGLLVLAVWMFSKTLHRYNLHDVMRDLRKMPSLRIALALLFVALSYIIQTGYDWLAAISVRIKIRPRRAAMAAFIGNAFTNNIGLSLVTGTSLRFRYYLAWGYSPLQTAELVTLSKLAFANGLFLFAGLTQIIAPVHLPDSFSLPFPQRALGCALILPTLLLLLWNGLSRSDVLKLRKFRMVRPAQSLLILQIALSSLHLACAAGTFYFLLPADALRAAGLSGPLAFLGTFMAIKFVVLLLPIPGNLGVFEGGTLAVLTPAMPANPVLGALVAYRLAYYVLPFAIALLLMLGYELTSRQGAMASMLHRKDGGKK